MLASRIPHPAPLSQAEYSAVEIALDGRSVVWLDQRGLPHEEVYVTSASVRGLCEAIRSLAIRGAPAIGIAGGYAMALAAHKLASRPAHFAERLSAIGAFVSEVRPTAVNLRWAVHRMLAHAGVLATQGADADEQARELLEEARRIHREDVAACRAMGALGAPYVPDGATILTHCNAGALATGGYGTALGVIRAAHAMGKRIRVLADETRPVLQGARLTAWELMRDGIDVTVITDGMVAERMRARKVDLVIVGADRIAANGDVANKIGTYGVACLARHHDIPFYVAAPTSTIDLSCPTGDAIPIEQRHGDEVRMLLTARGPVPVAPSGVSVYNPSFDVTPQALIRAIFTQRGVAEPPNPGTLQALMGEA